MNNRAKEIVTSFYQTDPVTDLDSFLKFLHHDVVLEWHSSFGMRTLNFQAVKETFSNMRSSFRSFESDVKDVICESNKVVVRHTYIAKTIERPEKEDEVGHFITIWELKDEKLYKAYQISQQASKF